MFKDVKKIDLLLLFQCLFQQVPEFSPSSKLMELVQSLLFSKERKAILNEDKDEETMDPTSHMDDHDYLDQAKPVIIPILERDKNTGIVANISQDNPRNEQKGSVYKAKYWFSQKKAYKCHLCHVEISIPPQIGRKGRLAEKIETEHLTSVHGFELKQCKLCNASCVDVEKHMVRRHSFKKCHICGYFAQSKKKQNKPKIFSTLLTLPLV